VYHDLDQFILGRFLSKITGYSRILQLAAHEEGRCPIRDGFEKEKKKQASSIPVDLATCLTVCEDRDVKRRA
jgi:hypothetical protein